MVTSPGHMNRTRPVPAGLVHLQASDVIGCACVGLVIAETAAGLWLSASPLVASWIAGQLLLAFALVQWFVLLHECGHGTLFATRRWNVIAGHVAGACALIPFGVWRRIHARHHRWTGWQDIDPTTAALTPRALSPIERFIVNTAWRLWIPLFAVLYRTGNFWNVPRLIRLFPEPRVRLVMVIEIVACAALLTGLWLLVGTAAALRLVGLAMLLAFVAEELLIVSQHTHMPMTQSGGHAVAPYSPFEQEVFTRSLRLPRWLSPLVLHFDAHELHHMYPFVPGYHLARVPYVPMNEAAWSHWIPAARAVPGEVFFFQHRARSGFDI